MLNRAGSQADHNPIEQVWRAIKRQVSATFVVDYEHMIATIIGVFKKQVAKKSYWRKWAIKFLSPKYASKLLGE